MACPKCGLPGDEPGARAGLSSERCLPLDSSVASDILGGTRPSDLQRSQRTGIRAGKGDWVWADSGPGREKVCIHLPFTLHLPPTHTTQPTNPALGIPLVTLEICPAYCVGWLEPGHRGLCHPGCPPSHLGVPTGCHIWERGAWAYPGRQSGGSPSLEIAGCPSCPPAAPTVGFPHPGRTAWNRELLGLAPGG